LNFIGVETALLKATFMKKGDMPPAMDGQLIKPPARLRFVRPCTGALSGVAPVSSCRRHRRRHH
jgi:hypothetical protein